MDDADESESDVQIAEDSSSEGEYSPMPEESDFKFDISAWNATPGGDAMSYMCLVPFSNGYTPIYNQSEHGGKTKVSTFHRKCRVKSYSSGGARKIADEKRLRNAANGNDINLVQELLENGVDSCCPDDKKRTPLHFAASQGNETVVKALLDYGAEVNTKDVLGNTPLHLAACTGQVPVVTLLLKAGTDLKLVDQHGRTPLTIAQSRLKFLAEVKEYSSQRVKNEALKICEMMKTYLDLSGLSGEVEHLDKLCDQLRQVSTREEVDQINVLLSDLADLSINRKQAKV